MDLLNWIGQTAAASGVAIIAGLWLSTTKIGEQFLGHRFNRDLAALRHEQDQKISGLKAELDHLTDRGKRSNEREYEAVTAVWEKFIDIGLSTRRGIIQFIQHPDLTPMSDDELVTFLESAGFSAAQKQSVKRANAQGRNKAYTSTVSLRYLAEASNDQYDFRLLLQKRGIFLPKELADAFAKNLEKMADALGEARVKFEFSSLPSQSSATLDLVRNEQKAREELGELVRARLMREDKVST